MDDYLQANRQLWDHWTHEHEISPFYDLEAFKAGKDRLRSIELEELGDVSSKSLLHLQCHFGMDTLAWARRGAAVTGIDLSPQSITLARALSDELNIPAQFYCADVATLPGVLDGRFDIGFNIAPEDYMPLMIRSAVNAGITLPPQALQMLDAPSLGSVENGLRSLGLSLEERRAPLDHLIVDSMERTPTDN